MAGKKVTVRMTNENERKSDGKDALTTYWGVGDSDG